MKYIAIIDEEMLSNFRIDDPPCYMSEDDKILVVKDELGYTRGIQLKPLPKGHGRLIDADELYDGFIDGTEGYDCQTWNRIEIGDIIDNIPTIIETDEESD